MKNIATIFAVLILLVGCAKGQGAMALTATVARPTPSETVITEPTSLPTETPRITPRRDLTKAIANPPQDAYPPMMFEPSITPLPSDYPPPRLVENTYTPAPTPTPLTPIEAAQQAWDDCKQSDIPPDMAEFQDQRLAGLVFRYWNWLWQIDADGRPAVVSCFPLSNISLKGRWMTFWLNKSVWVVDRETNVVQGISSNPERYSAPGSWSPDERFFYYLEAMNEVEPTDIWVWDSLTGQSRQVTRSPEASEFGVRVWPAYPDWLLFISQPPDMPHEPDAYGYLSIIRLDGSGEQTLDESLSPSFDFSPDGKTLAYRGFSDAWLLRPGEAPEPFLPEHFSIENWNIKSLSRPGWSPDGTKIAWYASGENSTGEYSGAAVFDLVENKAWFVHPFIHIGMGGSPFFFEWDPSSVWLAMGIPDQDPSKQGIWVARYDGSEEYHNGLTTFGITWGPAGDQFVYKDASDKKIYLNQVGSWTSQEISLPFEAYALGWAEIKAP